MWYKRSPVLLTSTEVVFGTYLCVMTMEGGFPMFNCLLKHTLKSLCSSSDPSKWVYAVFWRILPRNFPPPKWEFGGSTLDLLKGDKRNWILVWEDGYCDLEECKHMKGRFGADVFFKMSHEVYNYGEGFLGKVAADNSHRWVFRTGSKDDYTDCFTSWKMSVDPQPRAWEMQFNSGIQTIALISVREGMIQLGSFDKAKEDVKLVSNTQRLFSYLQSIPGVSPIPRPNTTTYNYIPTNPYTIEPNEKHQSAGSKRAHDEAFVEPPLKMVNLGWTAPQSGLAPRSMWSLPSLFPAWSCNHGPFLSPYSGNECSELSLIAKNMDDFRQREKHRDSENQETKAVKVEPDCAQEGKSCCLIPNHRVESDNAAKKSRFADLNTS